ncbi:MAG: leucine-rich repeat domain-containing protein [Bacteroidetes bacterium]|nr:leucine-rich repeat domain-containing protein [Bacteroidota bacterium]
MNRIFSLSLFLLFPLAIHAEKTPAEKAMYSEKRGKPIETALKNPLRATFVEYENYSDSVFPDDKIMLLRNVEHLSVQGRFCREKKTDSLQAPLKIRIDTLRLKELKNLKYLELSYFNFDDFPMGICCLDKLKGLAIGVSFADTIPEEISRMKSLEVLMVRVNNLKTLPASIAEMDSLTVLDLANNLFTDIPPQILKMKNIHSVIFSNNEAPVPVLISSSWPYECPVNHLHFDLCTPTVTALLNKENIKELSLSAPGSDMESRMNFEKSFNVSPAQLKKLQWTS